MSTNALAKVIHEVDAKIASQPFEGAKVVIIDRGSKQILAKKPWITLGKDLRYFRVFSRSLAVEGKGPRCEIQGGSFDDRLELDILYRARCPAGEEERVVAALGLGERPDLELNRWLRRQLETFVDNLDRPDDAYLRFHELLPEIERYLATAAPRDTGLSLKVQIRTHNRAESPERIDLSIKNLEVHANDSDERIKIHLETQLDIHDPGRALRHPGDSAEWQRRLSESVRRFVSTEVRLHELVFELRTGLRGRLQRHLDQELVGAGRRIGFLRLDSSYDPKGLVKDLRLEHAVQCDIQGSSKRINVQHVIQLELRDLGKYRISGVSDFEPWVRGRLDRLTRTALFDMTYRDLLVQFAPGESQGPNRLRQESEALLETVGFTVRQMTVVPDLEPLRWKDGFTLEHEGTYATLDSRIEVDLAVVAEGRIADIFTPSLSRYLDPQAAKDMLADMKKRMVAALAGKLHGLSPERFYMRWRHTHRADEEPVVDLLTRAVRDVMSREFGVVHPHVVVKPLETELSQRVESLMSRLYPLEVEVYPLGGKGRREKVTLCMNVEVLGVHEQGWHTFRARRYESPQQEVDEVLRLLQEEIKATLATIPSEYLQFVDRGDHLKLEEVLQTTRRSIVQACGLVVTFTGFRRRQTLSETQNIRLLADDTEKETQLQMDVGQERRNARLRQLQSQVATEEKLSKDLDEELNILLKRKKELLEDGVESDDPDYQAVQERIEEIRESLAPTEIDRRQDPLDHLEYRDRSTLRLEEYGVDSSPSSSRSLDTKIRNDRALT